MAINKKRQYVQNLRTSGKGHPVDGDSFVVHEGEIALSMDNDFPSIWFKKNDGTYAQFVDRQMIANMELAIEKALSELKVKVEVLEEFVGLPHI